MTTSQSSIVTASSTAPQGVRSGAGGLMLGGSSVRSVIIDGCEPERWREVNQASMGEYQDHHARAYPAETLQVMRLFAGFVSRHLGAATACLDVGCGLSVDPPPYADRLAARSAYCGLDPLRAEVLRAYPFIQGRLEDLPNACPELRFDGFLFSTSLDHVEDVVAAAQAVRALAGSGACAVFWVGLHDRELQAAPLGARLVASWMSGGRYRGFLRSLAWPLWGYWQARSWLDGRDGALRAGRPLDRLHFHYFTRASLPKALSHFGHAVEVVEVPGTNSCFAAISVL